MGEVEVYRDAEGGYRWRARAANGEIVADSGESYTREADAKEAAGKFGPDFAKDFSGAADNGEAPDPDPPPPE